MQLISMFQVDGSHIPDVKRRVAMARQRAGKLRHIWMAGELSLDLKMRLYRSACCSMLTYGSETWTLDEPTRKIINGANAGIPYNSQVNPRRSNRRDENVRPPPMDQSTQVAMGWTHTSNAGHEVAKAGATHHLRQPQRRRHPHGHPPRERLTIIARNGGKQKIVESKSP